MKMNRHGQEAVLQVLRGFCVAFKKRYCYPSQDTLLRSLNTKFGIEISKRSLNYWLRELEDEGWIGRLRRLRRGKTGELEFFTTLYTLKRKTLKLLFTLANRLIAAAGKSFRPGFRRQKKQPLDTENIERGWKPDFNQARKIFNG